MLTGQTNTKNRNFKNSTWLNLIMHTFIFLTPNMGLHHSTILMVLIVSSMHLTTCKERKSDMAAI